MKTVLYVITDKKVTIPLLKDVEGYQLIQSGPNSNPDYGYPRVNTGDNIADLNWFYAELTAFYWVWKHIDCDIVGFLHYRRFLYLNDHLVTIDEVEDLLNHYDLIVRTKAAYGYPFDTWWVKCGHYKEDLACLKEVVDEIHPEYRPSYDYIINQETRGYHADNIMICKKTLFDEYCLWIFPILEALKERIDFSKFPDGPFKGKKLAAYLGEILLDVWIHYHNYRAIALSTKGFDRHEFDA